MAPKGPIRLLIVDDSLVTRSVLERLVAPDPGIVVVGKAENGRQAVEMAQRLRPDIITLDIEMPVMNGLEALQAIMAECPTRVLMLSSLTTEGADATLDALAHGAVDFLPKPGLGPLELQRIRDHLLAKVHALGAAPFRPGTRPGPGAYPGTVPATAPTAPPAPLAPKAPFLARRAGTGRKEILLIGTSTGGPAALQAVIPALPGDLPVGVLVVQHMPPAFTGQLAKRLDRLSALTVKEAEEGDLVRPGLVLIAPGHSHLVMRRAGHVGLDQEPADLPHRPAVDVMVASATAVYGSAAVGVIMTGMGQDGRKGMAALKARGGTVIAQDEASCIVYGMPKAVVDAGLADCVRPLELLAATILQYLG